MAAQTRLVDVKVGAGGENGQILNMEPAGLAEGPGASCGLGPE